MKYVKYALAIVVLAIAVTAATVTPKKITQTDFLLDTYVSVTVYGNHKDAIEAVLEKVRDIQTEYSAYEKDSYVACINDAPAGESVSVSEECFSLLLRAAELSDLTQGAFDITVKPVMDLWDFNAAPRVPDAKELDAALVSVNYQNLTLNAADKTVTKTAPDVKIDLGGIAKGYAADCAATILREAGVESAILDFGGNVVTIGERPIGLLDRIRTGKKTKPFVVGIQSPTEVRGTVAETVTATDSPCAVVTSGGYERAFSENGKTYHHIINPKTGTQPENGILSVTVVSKDSTTADALSTALFVLGEDGIPLAEGLYDELIFIKENGEIKRYTKE